MSLWNTKFFMIYLLTYKMFQGTFQSLIPIWLKNHICYDIKTINTISGLVPSITSLLGTGLGGSIPGMIQKQMQKDKNKSTTIQLIKDIWFWLIFIMFLLALVTNIIVDDDFSAAGKNMFNCT